MLKRHACISVSGQFSRGRRLHRSFPRGLGLPVLPPHGLSLLSFIEKQGLLAMLNLALNLAVVTSTFLPP